MPSAGASRYLVEPNIKDGKGGLRDLHTLHWLAKHLYPEKAEEEFVETRVFTPGEYRSFRRCESFLWSVRCQLHFLTDRPEERLSFDLQPVMAERLGYRSHAGLRAGLPVTAPGGGRLPSGSILLPCGTFSGGSVPPESSTLSVAGDSLGLSRMPSVERWSAGSG